MSSLETALLVAFVLVVVAALFVGASLAERLFAAMNPIADRWRPTESGETRPGHTLLGLGASMAVVPVYAVIRYDLGPALISLPGSLQGLSLSAFVSLVIVMVVIPLTGAWALLSWKNKRLELSGARIRLTSVFGHQTDWLQVLNAWVDPGLRGPGQVWFEFSDGRACVQTDWVNIREIYESLASAGISVEPWPQAPPKKAFWSR